MRESVEAHGKITVVRLMVVVIPVDEGRMEVNFSNQ